jgi:hypothetical protein
MDEDYILRQIVGAYNPEDALNLPFIEQWAIIRELTGFTVSEPEIARLYLELQERDVLVDDPRVALAMREQLLAEGYRLPLLEDLRDYITTKDLAVLAREPSNWELLQEQYSEQFPNLLLRAGTSAARTRFEQLVDREMTPEEEQVAWLAALQVGDFANLDYFEGLDAGLNFDYSTPEDRQKILHLIDKQVRNAVAYELQGSDDFTVFFIPTYYLAEAVVEFIYYMSLWDEESRSHMLSNLPGWADIGDFDVNNQVIQAYLEIFPDDEAAREITLGGGVALRQINYPSSMSEHSRARGPHYQAGTTL